MPMVTLDESVESSESLWKQKLLTRTVGLNARQSRHGCGKACGAKGVTAGAARL
jgi:hypothetical protein